MWTVSKRVSGNGYYKSFKYTTSSKILAYVRYYYWKWFDFNMLGLHQNKRVVMYRNVDRLIHMAKSYTQEN